MNQKEKLIANEHFSSWIAVSYNDSTTGRPIQAFLSRGRVIGSGESGVVREAYLATPLPNDQEGVKSVAVKSYHQQDAIFGQSSCIDPNLAKQYTQAYDEQSIYWEVLKRMKVKVIPLFAPVSTTDGTSWGIIMTNLCSTSLDNKSDISSVTTTKSDLIGRRLTAITRARDRQLARNAGLLLAEDAWMLQYLKSNLGITIPQAIVSDLIGTKLDHDKFNKFLKQKYNFDLEARVNANISLRIKLL